MTDGLPKKCWDHTLPIGNTTRTYKEILRDWNFGDKPWHFLSWNTPREPYFYIKVEPNNAKKFDIVSVSKRAKMESV